MEGWWRKLQSLKGANNDKNLGSVQVLIQNGTLPFSWIIPVKPKDDQNILFERVIILSRVQP